MLKAISLLRLREENLILFKFYSCSWRININTQNTRARRMLQHQCSKFHCICSHYHYNKYNLKKLYAAFLSSNLLWFYFYSIR